MASGIVSFNDHTNRLLNMIKAKFDLKNKSDAVNFVIEKYGNEALEEEVRPEYIEKIRKLMKQPAKKYSSLAEMAKEYD